MNYFNTVYTTRSVYILIGKCLVYSFGSNNQFDYEQAILDQLGLYLDTYTCMNASNNLNHVK